MKFRLRRRAAFVLAASIAIVLASSIAVAGLAGLGPAPARGVPVLQAETTISQPETIHQPALVPSDRPPGIVHSAAADSVAVESATRAPDGAVQPAPESASAGGLSGGVVLRTGGLNGGVVLRTGGIGGGVRD
jgi:hypothetical protein